VVSLCLSVVNLFGMQVTEDVLDLEEELLNYSMDLMEGVDIWGMPAGN
jgi:hypothetical protein